MPAMTNATTRAEAARIAEHQAALHSLREFGTPLCAPDPVLVIDHRRASLADVYGRDWEEFAADAAAEFAASEEKLRAARDESARVYGGAV